MTAVLNAMIAALVMRAAAMVGRVSPEWSGALEETGVELIGLPAVLAMFADEPADLNRPQSFRLLLVALLVEMRAQEEAGAAGALAAVLRDFREDRRKNPEWSPIAWRTQLRLVCDVLVDEVGLDASNLLVATVRVIDAVPERSAVVPEGDDSDPPGEP